MQQHLQQPFLFHKMQASVLRLAALQMIASCPGEYKLTGNAAGIHVNNDHHDNDNENITVVILIDNDHIVVIKSANSVYAISPDSHMKALAVCRVLNMSLKNQSRSCLLKSASLCCFTVMACGCANRLNSRRCMLGT